MMPTNEDRIRILEDQVERLILVITSIMDRIPKEQ